MAPPTYVYSGNCYVATADQTTFSLTSSAGNAIPYLDRSHIKVRTSDDDGGTWISLTSGTEFTFSNPAVSIILTTPVAAGTWVDIQRSTPLGSIYVQFQAGSLLTSEQLNEAERYSLYCDQEIVDGNVDFDPGDIGLNSTDDLPEGSVNLYYTDARVEAWINANLADTDDLAEGSTNLYYTDARVEAYVSGAGYIKDAGVTKIVAGANVVISPTSGIGEVTIASIGGGGGGGGFNYKGEIDATQPAPAGPQNGDLYVNTAAGVVGSGWTGIVGDAITGNERLIYSDVGSWALLVDNGIPDAPVDGNLYGRKDAAWESITIPAAPVQSDWNVTDSASLAFIKNKPSIPTVSTPTLQQVCTEGTVTDTKIQAAGFRVDQLTTLP